MLSSLGDRTGVGRECTLGRAEARRALIDRVITVRQIKVLDFVYETEMRNAS